MSPSDTTESFIVTAMTGLSLLRTNGPGLPKAVWSQPRARERMTRV